MESKIREEVAEEMAQQLVEVREKRARCSCEFMPQKSALRCAWGLRLRLISHHNRLICVTLSRLGPHPLGSYNICHCFYKVEESYQSMMRQTTDIAATT